MALPIAILMIRITTRAVSAVMLLIGAAAVFVHSDDAS
jgi:hypothetical protein